MNHIADANKMVGEDHIRDARKMVSDTPRTDARVKRMIDNDQGPEGLEYWARDLERELNAANDRIKRLEDGIAKQNQTIEQACGKVLGYPWFKDDQKNFPGATEKDGVCVGEHVAETVVCELVGKYTEALARIKRLEEAGDALKAAGYFGGFGDAVNKWIKVREDKP